MIQDDIKEFSRTLTETAINDILKDELEAFMEEALNSNEKDYKNGYYERKCNSTFGVLNIKMPRDRLNLFKTNILQKYQRNFSDIEEECVKLYSKGLSNSQISNYIEENYSGILSQEKVRNIVNSSLTKVNSFNTRKLPKCVFVFLDGTYVPIKRSYYGGPKKVEKECVEVALGITEDGKPIILSYYFIPNEGSTSWKENIADLKARGIGNPKMFITDGLNGLEDAIKAVYPNTKYQTCIVHLNRNLMKKVRKNDRKEVSNDFMQCFKKETADDCKLAFEEFCKKWSLTYPKAINDLKNVSGMWTYTSLPRCLWRGFYTSNRIEGFNASLKRVTRKKILLNSEKNALIVLTNCCESYNASARIINNIQLLTVDERKELGLN